MHSVHRVACSDNSPHRDQQVEGRRTPEYKGHSVASACKPCGTCRMHANRARICFRGTRCECGQWKRRVPVDLHANTTRHSDWSAARARRHANYLQVARHSKANAHEQDQGEDSSRQQHGHTRGDKNQLASSHHRVDLVDVVAPFNENRTGAKSTKPVT